jgi:glutathione synthase/RimK-type ligase-like ATP-grasp enzyme
MPNALWINPRNSNFNPNDKVIQLFLAKQLGFHIPPTLISTDPIKTSDFLEWNVKSIYKVLTWFSEYPNKLIFTSRVDSKKVIDNADSIKVCPGIFQREIEKSFEFRVTTVGKKIFSVMIDSQTLERTKLDWRRNRFEVPYSIYNLPNKIENLINKMNIKLGLHFAAYDFIVTPNDEVYFLEVNPGGQWLWIENQTNLQISKALAEYMLSGQ